MTEIKEIPGVIEERIIVDFRVCDYVPMKKEKIQTMSKVNTLMTYFDFAQTPLSQWREQEKLNPDVRVFFCQRNKCWCREIKNVRVYQVENGDFYPYPGQLVTYGICYKGYLLYLEKLRNEKA